MIGFGTTYQRQSLVAGLMGLLLMACSKTDQPGQAVIPAGLTAEYFANTDFSGPSWARVDSRVQFSWQEVSPVRGILPGQFSVRWQGYLLSDRSESVRPILNAEGEARLWIEGKEILAGQSIDLKANQSYALKLEYVKTEPTASISLEWQRTGMEAEVIAQKYFEPLAASLVLTPITGVVKGENLLINADFEGNEGGWLNYGGQVAAVPSDLIASNTSLSLNNWAWVQQDLPVSDIEIGTAYTLFGNAKAEPGGSCTMAIVGGSTTGKLFEEKARFTSQEWQDKELNLLIPSATVWLAVYISSEGPSCQFDDLSLVAGDTSPSAPPTLPVTPQSPLSNGDFESELSRWGLYGGSASVISPGQSGSGKALELGAYTWVQQDLISARYIPAANYKISAYAKAIGGGTCKLGYVVAAASSTLINESLEFNTANWQEKSLIVSIPESFAWSAIYLSSADSSCQFDDIKLEKQ